MNVRSSGAAWAIPIVLCFSAWCSGAPVYFNDFGSGAASLTNLQIVGSTNFNVGVADGQLVIATSGSSPGPFGHAVAALDTRSLAPRYQSVLGLNTGLVTWSFNLANQDGLYNNTYLAVLACNDADPFPMTSKGYCFQGGGMVRNRFVLRRLELGVGGGGVFLIDSTNGPGPLPVKASVRITFNPASHEWKLYSSYGASYVDPRKVTTLIGSAIDDVYVHDSRPYFALGGNLTGYDYFDNVKISVGPEWSVVVGGFPQERGIPRGLGYGTNYVDLARVITNSVDSPVDGPIGTRYVCSGWTGTGDVPVSGAGTSQVLTVTQDSTLTWIWQTEHALSLSAVFGAIQGATGGWKPEGFVYDLAPSNSVYGYAFDHWQTNGIPAGAAVPFSIAMQGPRAVEAVFVPVFCDATTLTSIRYSSWTLNRQSGTMFANLVLSNRSDSVKGLIAPFRYAVTRTAKVRLMHPDGRTSDGKDYVDITAQVLAALPFAGNHDAVLDPGEWVAVSSIEFYSVDRSIPSGYTYAVWCDPPGAALSGLAGRDTDGDGMPNEWERLHGLCENDPGDAAADADGDGMNNLAEYVADTDPLSTASSLELTACERKGNGVLLRLKGGSSVTQYVEMAQTPGGPWVPVGTNVPPMASDGVLTVRVDGVDFGFLRIKVQR